MSRIGKRIAPLALFAVLASGCTGTAEEEGESILEMLPGRASQELEKQAALARQIAALKAVCGQFNEIGTALETAGVETRVEGVYHEPEPPEPWSDLALVYDRYRDYGTCAVKAGGWAAIFGDAEALADQRNRQKIADGIIEAMPPGDLLKVRDVLPTVLAGAIVHGLERLALAAFKGHTEAVKLLIESGAEVRAWDDEPLRLAAMRGHTDIVRLLLQAGADVHARDDEALCMAAFYGHTETVEVLLDAGANVQAQDNYALRWALANGHSGTAAALKQWIAPKGRDSAAMPGDGGTVAVRPMIG